MSAFFAILARMKHITRWGLMRNTQRENLVEHSYETAVIAHALAVIKNTRFGGQIDPHQAATAALFHDASEILTGDMPTPVKYYNPALKTQYKQLEKVANEKLLALLPADLKPEYESLFALCEPGFDLYPLIKAADKISALIKCLQEQNMGNREFDSAEKSLRAAVTDMHLPEADVFLAEFLPAFLLNLDELQS